MMTSTSILSLGEAGKKSLSSIIKWWSRTQSKRCIVKIQRASAPSSSGGPRTQSKRGIVKIQRDTGTGRRSLRFKEGPKGTKGQPFRK
ncbi:hypothetical protein GBAR_LOCUS21648 [Geodia barretti]|uniref:Uncharacterized protein n=1 Tax=Geodia barretti TaxID=519541 RepID=A0AA35X400_GEOBA|nr:hypothetical protein GBAR_LOCUS21648 [Geodia barretti]